MSAQVEQDEHLALARRLVDAIESGDHNGADDLLKALNDGRFEALFKEVGKLTRELHDTFGNLAADERLVALAREHMPDARDRLNFVISKTEEAADRTLSAVETLQPVTEDLAGGAAELRAQAQASDDIDSLRRQLLAFLDRVDGSCCTLRGGLTEVMLAQEYQDLTGQVIKRTIGLVNQVEEKLVELVSACGTITRGTPARAVNGGDGSVSHGPAIALQDGVLARQDDVDELLADLGF